MKVLGEIEGSSLIVSTHQSPLIMQQKNCEAETLKVFRLLTSQVCTGILQGAVTRLGNICCLGKWIENHIVSVQGTMDPWPYIMPIDRYTHMWWAGCPPTIVKQVKRTWFWCSLRPRVLRTTKPRVFPKQVPVPSRDPCCKQTHVWSQTQSPAAISRNWRQLVQSCSRQKVTWLPIMWRP